MFVSYPICKDAFHILVELSDKGNRGSLRHISAWIFLVFVVRFQETYMENSMYLESRKELDSVSCFVNSFMIGKDPSYLYTNPLCTLRRDLNWLGWSLIFTMLPTGCHLVSAYFFIRQAALLRQAFVMFDLSCHSRASL